MCPSRHENGPKTLTNRVGAKHFSPLLFSEKVKREKNWPLRLFRDGDLEKEQLRKGVRQVKREANIPPPFYREKEHRNDFSKPNLFHLSFIQSNEKDNIYALFARCDGPVRTCERD